MNDKRSQFLTCSVLGIRKKSYVNGTFMLNVCLLCCSWRQLKQQQLLQRRPRRQREEPEQRHQRHLPTAPSTHQRASSTHRWRHLARRQLHRKLTERWNPRPMMLGQSSETELEINKNEFSRMRSTRFNGHLYVGGGVCPGGYVHWGVHPLPNCMLGYTPLPLTGRQL